MREGLGGRSGFSVPGSTALGSSEVSELHVTGSMQAVMADGTRIKGQAEARRAGFHNLRPVAMFSHKGKKGNSSHIIASRKTGGWLDRWKDRPALPVPHS